MTRGSRRRRAAAIAPSLARSARSLVTTAAGTSAPQCSVRHGLYLPRRHIHHPLTRGGPTNGVQSERSWHLRCVKSHRNASQQCERRALGARPLDQAAALLDHALEDRRHRLSSAWLQEVTTGRGVRIAAILGSSPPSVILSASARRDLSLTRVGNESVLRPPTLARHHELRRSVFRPRVDEDRRPDLRYSLSLVGVTVQTHS
jgi:hypothetical protein